MTKKTIAVSLIATSVLSFSSCQKEMPENKQEEIVTISDVEGKARNEVYDFIKSIYTNAYNGEIIDVIKVDSMSVSRGYITPEALRSVVENTPVQDVEEVLSPQMLHIYNKMLSFLKDDNSMSREERDILLSMSASLSGQERVDMESIIRITDYSISALNQLSKENAVGLRSWEDIGTFACNMASGGIGSVWGSMGGAIAAVAGASSLVTGGVSLVVGLAVGSAISSMAC